MASQQSCLRSGKVVRCCCHFIPCAYFCVETTKNDWGLKVEYHIDQVFAYLPVSTDRLQKISGEQLLDPICSLVIKYCSNEWPLQSQISYDLQPYYHMRYDLVCKRGLLLKSDQIVMPMA